MSDPIPSPRKILLSAVSESLQRIRISDGYRTDAGLDFTLEPVPAVSDGKQAFVTAVWAKQERPTELAVVRSHRLTTFHVVAKVPASLGDAQDRLDDIVTDIEQAMADQQFRYPGGYQFPVYVQAVPIPVEITAGWIGAEITYTTHIPKR